MSTGSYGSYGLSAESDQKRNTPDEVAALVTPANSASPVTLVRTAPVDPSLNSPQPQKDFLVAWLLSLFLGVFGADRFYLGKIGTGVIKLVTFGGVGIWWLIDLIMILAGKVRDKNGNALEGYESKKKVAWAVSGGLLVLSLIINILEPSVGCVRT